MANGQDNLVYANGDHIWFYDEINEQSALRFNSLLHEVSLRHGQNMMNSVHEVGTPAPIWVHLNTPGGHVTQGLAMHDTILRINETIPIIVIIEGLAASMGAIVAQAAVQRFIRRNAFMLIHQIRGGAFGPLDEMEDQLRNAKLLNKNLKNIIKDKSKLSKELLESLFKKDLFLDAKKCKRYGLVDDII